jgi:hypothetical protein
MIFSLRRTELRHADPCQPNRRYRIRPMLPLVIIGPTGRRTRQTLVDTGAAGTILPMALATAIGIREFQSSGMLQGIGGARSPSVHYGEVLLRIHQGAEVCQWRSFVGFPEAPLLFEGILGISGGLEYFHTTLDVFASQLTMIPRISLPVATDLA